MESQLTILSESLDRKLEVLQKIQEYNKRQEEVFSADHVMALLLFSSKTGFRKIPFNRKIESVLQCHCYS